MQSKWINWRPSSVGFVGSLAKENSIVESKRDAGTETSCTARPSTTEQAGKDVPSEPTKPFPTDAAYSELACLSMQRVAAVCPPGALKWAREAHPALTDKIDVELLARLNDLWSTHAPLPEFQATLDELVLIHEEVGRLFEGDAGL